MGRDSKQISFVARLTVTLLVLVGVFFALVTYVSIRVSNDASVQKAITDIEDRNRIQSSAASRDFVLIEDDLWTIRQTPPVQGIIRAVDNQGVDSADQSSYSQWTGRLEEIFVSLAERRPAYSQIRYIDENGQELVRINNFKQDIEVVPASQLQNKANRYYFEEAIAKSSDQLYVSKVDLNREGSDQVIQPDQSPVIRYSLPVDDQQGRRRGLVIINVDVDKLLSQLVDVESDNHQNYVVGKQLNILYDGAGRQWLNPEANAAIEAAIPGAGQIGAESDHGTVEMSDFFASYSKIQLVKDSEDYYLWFIEKRDVDTVLAGNTAYIAQITTMAAGFFLVLVLVGGWLLRRLTLPISQLGKAAEVVGRKGSLDYELKQNHGGEIGQAMKAFNSMSKRLSQYKDHMEAEVAERTRELALFKQAAESSSEHVVITDADGVVIYANPAVKKMTGYAPKEVLGKKAGSKDLWGGLMDKSFYKKMWRTLKVDKKSFTGEITNKHKNGKSYIASTSISPILDEQGEVKYFIGIERDVTLEKQVDKAKTEFVSLASHQLRTPLSAIRWYSEILEGSKDLKPKDRNYVIEIYDSAKRMIDMVNALLNVSRIELGTLLVMPEKVDLNNELRKTVEDVCAVAKTKEIKVSYTLDKQLPNILADPKLIRMILENLLTNAVKYTEKGGWVKVEINKLPKQRLDITVSDNGVGIPQKEQPRIFDKLFRATNVQNLDVDGTGLGLYLVKQVAELLEGKIEFESPYKMGGGKGSKTQQGTKFTVTLPYKKA